MNRLTEFAARQQSTFDKSTTPSERKDRGHFGTPASVASFMSSLLTIKPNLRLVDAGAGVGILSAAVADILLQREGEFSLYVEAWENDPKLFGHLRATLAECKKELGKNGHDMRFDIVAGDFILGSSTNDLFNAKPSPTFDVAIMNPPYFKLRKDSSQARMMEHVVHGQPNIYALFMAQAAELLVDGGELVAITPRSYFNGSYFKKFRKWFFDTMTVRQIHTFETRNDVFQKDAVLQENIILKAVKNAPKEDVILTASVGRAVIAPVEVSVPYGKVVDNSLGDHIIRVTTGHDERNFIDAIDRLPCRFNDLPFKISTGPVVTFRSTEFLRDDRDADTAPLLWMHNVRPFVTRFPPKNGKPTHIKVSDDSKKLLLPSKRYVLLKRFTAKEERRRLVAGIFTANDSYSDFVGLENHLNYVYSPKGEMTEAEAYGMAGYFNSAIIDRYFRAVSGNTQVNATEVRALPTPDVATIRKIGEQLRYDADEVDVVVGRALGFTARQIERIREHAE